MFGTIRRHQTWLWLVIATITIASFVIYFNPASRTSRGPQRSQGSLGRLDGREITQAELADTIKEYQLMYILQNRGERAPSMDSAITRFESYKRLFLIHQLALLGIDPGDKAVAQLAAKITGSASLEEFADRILKPQGLDANDFARFLRHELGIEQLTATAGIGGQLITTNQAAAFYRANHEEATTALVYFGASKFQAGVSVTPEALTNYYTNQMNIRYHLRDRVQVDYVRFDNSNYLATAAARFTNLDKMVDESYNRGGSNLFAGLTNEAAVKLRLRNTFLTPYAALEARRAAGEFAETVDHLPAKNAEEFDRAAASNKFTVLTTAPFDLGGPKGLDVSEAFTLTAFRLATNEPFGGPVTNQDAAFVLALKQSLPSRLEPLDEIRNRVTADFRNDQAVQLAIQAAQKFHTNLLNGLAQSNRFEAICASAGVTPETLPPFSLSTTNLPEEIEGRVSLNLLQRVVFGTPVGSASQVVPMSDGAFILYIEKRTPADEAKLKTELPQFTESLRRQRQNEAFNIWFNSRMSQDTDFMKMLQQVYMEAEAEAQGAGAQRRR